MKIAHDTNKMSHGVTTLAYVGDADAATDSTRTRDLAIAGAGALAALFGTGLTRILGIATSAYVVGKMRR